MITAADLRKILSYDAATGHFTWRTPRPKVRVGMRAGYVHHRGYRYIEIDARAYAEHRLAWLYVTDKWPKDQLDHINRGRDDNRFENLREASNAQNRANSKHANRTGFKGVSYMPRLREKPYGAQITVDRKVRWLGSYATAEEAHQAYLKAARHYHGVFAHSG